MTGAIRELKRSRPDLSITVNTPYSALWKFNPNIDKHTNTSGDGIRVDYQDEGTNFVGESNESRIHFGEAFSFAVMEATSLSFPINDIRPDLHLGNDAPDLDLPDRYWYLNAYGKDALSVKWWIDHRYQQLIDSLTSIPLVTARTAKDRRVTLTNLTDLGATTSPRDLIHIIANAAGVITPISLPMHVAGAFGVPCVVLAGGSEPVTWERYPGHVFLSTIGRLDCCGGGGCWRRRAHGAHREDPDKRCLDTVSSGDIEVARCMDMISVSEVMEAVELCEQRSQH